MVTQYAHELLENFANRLSHFPVNYFHSLESCDASLIREGMKRSLGFIFDEGKERQLNPDR